MTESLKLNACVFSVILLAGYIYYSSMTYISTGTFPDGIVISGLFAAIAAAFGFSFGKIYTEKKAPTIEDNKAKTKSTEQEEE